MKRPPALPNPDRKVLERWLSVSLVAALCGGAAMCMADSDPLCTSVGFAALVLAILTGAFALIRFQLGQRREAEAARERFFMLGLDMFCIASTDGYFKRVNPAFSEILGWSANELLDRPFLDFVHPDDRPSTIDVMKDLAVGKLIIHFENRYACKDGSSRLISWKAIPQPDGAIYATARDVTEVKRAEEALKAARSEADRANLAKSDFLSRMSHELRTPMNAILGFAQILEMSNPPDDQRAPIAHIIKAGEHLLDLINEVLDIARIEAGRMKISLEPVPLREVVEECVALIRPLADQHAVRIESGLESDCARHVLADRQRLKQAILNLLSNAVKFNRNGGSVTLSCEKLDSANTRANAAPSGKRLRLSIADTGFGIPSSELPRLFDAFERFDADRRGIQGSGLGLALTKRLLELMGASVQVRSEVNKGSVFTLDFQAVDRPAPPPIGVAEDNEFTPLAKAAEHTVLYIEDNPSNLRLVEHVMAHRPSIKLLAAMQGRLGLELAVEHRPDLILVDLNLPDISGREVLRRLRGAEETADIPVVIISADATTGEVDRMLGSGAAEYLTKPLDIRKFLTMLDRHLADDPLPKL